MSERRVSVNISPPKRRHTAPAKPDTSTAYEDFC